MFAAFPAVGVHVEARKEEKTKKKLLENAVFSWFPPLRASMSGKKGGKNEKNTF